MAGMQHPDGRVVVIGGGVIGLSTAYALMRQGRHVTLVESAPEVGLRASFANGGQLSYRYVSPMADGGVPVDALRWLLKADSPVALKPRLDWHQWRWLLQFLRACRGDINRRHTRYLLDFALHARTVLAEWRQEGLAPFDWSAPGKLILHREPGALAEAARHLTQPTGQRVLDEEACLALEPALAALSGRFAGGIFTADEEVGDCALFCRALLRALERAPGFRRVTGQAELVVRRGRAVARVAGEEINAAEIVVAAGMGSRALVRPLGLELPLYGLKGYSLTLEAPDGPVPSVSITDYANRIVYARIGRRFRVAAKVLIGARTAVPEADQIAVLRRHAQEAFPQEQAYEDATVWAEFRPATPTSLPIIGRVSALPNLFLNAGQGALGFTLAASSAALIADVMAGKPVASSFQHFAP